MATAVLELPPAFRPMLQIAHATGVHRKREIWFFDPDHNHHHRTILEGLIGNRATLQWQGHFGSTFFEVSVLANLFRHAIVGDSHTLAGIIMELELRDDLYKSGIDLLNFFHDCLPEFPVIVISSSQAILGSHPVLRECRPVGVFTWESLRQEHHRLSFNRLINRMLHHH